MLENIYRILHFLTFYKIVYDLDLNFYVVYFCKSAFIVFISKVDFFLWNLLNEYTDFFFVFHNLVHECWLAEYEQFSNQRWRFSVTYKLKIITTVIERYYSGKYNKRILYELSRTYFYLLKTSVQRWVGEDFACKSVQISGQRGIRGRALIRLIEN